LNGVERLEIIPLGGLGEFGMNMMVYRHRDDCIVVDCGMMFPGEGHLGVDVVIPDLSFLDTCGTIHGVVLTHGHEDHIGAVPYLLARHAVPVWATPHALGLVRARLAEHDGKLSRTLRELPGDGEPVALGPFVVETVRAAHSIPQSKMLLLRTPVGNVLHTADFKMDTDPPDGYSTDLERLRAIGAEGVLVLLSDSTNAERPGVTPGERSVARTLETLVAQATERVLVTTFSSNIQRIEQLARIAADCGRRLCPVGTSLGTQLDVAERLGLIRFPPGLRVAPEELGALPRGRVLVVATGSQGEPLSALQRIAIGKHRHVALEPGDLVIHSARRIPGNEKSIGRMIDHLLRRGARVITAEHAEVHASGHPSHDELVQLIDLVRPRFFVPIHGEFRQLLAHAELARAAGLPADSVRLAETGDVIAVDGRTIEVVSRVPVGRVFIDAALDEVDANLLRDRRRSAEDGIVVAVVAVDRDRGAIADYPQIVTRGFVPDGEGDGLREAARRIVVEALSEATPEERCDEALLRVRVQTELKRFLRRRTQRAPLIIPVIVEL
jgi:ribonuclease J